MKPLFAGLAFFAVTHACFAQAELGAPIETVLPPAVPASLATPIETVPPPAVPASLAAPMCVAQSAVETLVSPPTSTGSAWWVEADYLLWWIKRGPLPTPLVTTGNPTDALPGALGQSGTRALFGGSGLGYGAFSGGRFNLGGWLDDEQTIGVEGGGFLLGQRTIRFAVASDNAGNPPIYLPVINMNPASPNFGRSSSYTVADPSFPGTGPTSGNVAASSATRLWGAELNSLGNLIRTSSWSLDGLLGFRYMDLQENLNLSGFSNDQFDDLQQTFHDSFNTRNQFYGGQLGARYGFRSDRITFAATGKLAFGSTHQVVDIQGNSFYAGTGFALPPGVYPGGVYTQPSNIGRTTANRFAVIPQIGFKLGLNLTSRLSANVGYDFLYWSNVVRPGSQIDHNLNATQFPGAGVNGALLPAAQFNHTDFLAHGVSFGFLFQF